VFVVNALGIRGVTEPLDHFRFLRAWLTRPVLTRAVSPSGKALARAMARLVDPANPLPVLELGPGTGPVTTALIERGIAPERIVALEFNPDFCGLLVERFRGLNVVEGDAYDLAASLPPGLAGPYSAVVSSLPLLTRPPEDRETLIEGALDRMRKGGGLIQFSYGVKPPVPSLAGRFGVERTALVVMNLPPARVWIYRRI
jgi:phosphatidylethanolamine/phosphatidyl-N-methylethanolamine N-methyltransferase